MMFMEDMDTSESEHSDVEANDDDDEWVQSGKKPIRKRTSRSRGHSRMGIDQSDTGSSGDSKGSTDEVTGKTDGPCCTCSKSSLCKTQKCQCRANGSSCGQSCGCSSVKCSNREAEANLRNDVGTNEEQNLVAHGAMLLQNALESEKEAETNGDCATRRKPLSDIGNSLAKPNAPKPNQRKKWRKSVIQLVPVAPPAASHEENAAAQPANPETVDPPKKPDNCPTESDIPLKLPRAMRSASSNGVKLLRERNADQQDDSTNKEPAVLPSSSPLRPTRTSDEKENCHR